MERTINGKSFKEVLIELKKPFDEYMITQKGDTAPIYATIPKEWVDERLDNVLGLNYNVVIVGNPWCEEIGDSRYISLKGYISIVDDEGNEIIKRYATGTATVIMISVSQKGGIKITKPKDYANDYKTAFADLKKKCAKELGVSRYISLETQRNAKKGKIKAYQGSTKNEPSDINTSTPNTSNIVSGEEGTFKIVFTSKFKKIGQLYKADCTDTSTGEVKKIVVYSNKKESLSEKFWSHLIESDNIGKSFVFNGKSQNYSGEEQIIFYEYIKQ